MSVTEIPYGEFVESGFVESGFVDSGTDYFAEEQPRIFGLAPYFAVGFVVGVLLPLIMRLTLG